MRDESSEGVSWAPCMYIGRRALVVRNGVRVVLLCEIDLDAGRDIADLTAGIGAS